MFKDIRLSVVDSKSVEINTKCKVEVYNVNTILI